MYEDRSTEIQVGDQTYELLLNTRATKEIAGRYGGLENLGNKIMQPENFELALGEIVWLIVLLANQGIQVYNLKHRDAPRDLLTEDEMELLTVPADIAGYRKAIMTALQKGTRRDVVSEDSGKNTKAG